jgi:hypothetical protein
VASCSNWPDKADCAEARAAPFARTGSLLWTGDSADWRC